MNAGRVKLSAATPVATMLPQISGDWEKHASIEDLARIAEAADRLGYHHLTCSEHIAPPAAEGHRRGARYWDPLATFGYLAARTHRIRLATNVLVLAYHHPLNDPLTVTDALAPVIETRWRSDAVRPVFAGPLRSMIRWEAWPWTADAAFDSSPEK